MVQNSEVPSAFEGGGWKQTSKVVIGSKDAKKIVSKMQFQLTGQCFPDFVYQELDLFC